MQHCTFRNVQLSSSSSLSLSSSRSDLLLLVGFSFFFSFCFFLLLDPGKFQAHSCLNEMCPYSSKGRAHPPVPFQMVHFQASSRPNPRSLSKQADHQRNPFPKFCKKLKLHRTASGVGRRDGEKENASSVISKGPSSQSASG